MSLRQVELLWAAALCGVTVTAWCLLQSGARAVPSGGGSGADRSADGEGCR
ncbi:hypothetical protein ACIRBX_08510 [Kitasatospora sp. NPDC096147]|uniref:hypothetical protein n=1 Tax=Kitasatospora sp. NPDC096147 TaxID=3364093 RepID=UPI0038177E48